METINKIKILVPLVFIILLSIYIGILAYDMFLNTNKLLLKIVVILIVCIYIIIYINDLFSNIKKIANEENSLPSLMDSMAKTQKKLEKYKKRHGDKNEK